MRNANHLDKSVRWKSETAQLDRASDQRIFAWRQCKYNHRSTSGTISALVAFNPAVLFNPIHWDLSSQLQLHHHYHCSYHTTITTTTLPPPHVHYPHHHHTTITTTTLRSITTTTLPSPLPPSSPLPTLLSSLPCAHYGHHNHTITTTPSPLPLSQTHEETQTQTRTDTHRQTWVYTHRYKQQAKKESNI